MLARFIFRKSKEITLSEIERLIEQTIGSESSYLLEKSRGAIYPANSSNVDFVKSLLERYEISYEELHEKIKGYNFYDPMIYEEDFQTLVLACKKLRSMLGTINNHQDELVAKIFQNHISIQDKKLRQSLSNEK